MLKVAKDGAAAMPPLVIARSNIAVAPGEIGRAFAKIERPLTIASCVPPVGLEIVGVALRSVSRGVCHGGTARPRADTDHVIVPLEGETWSDVIARAGELAPESFLVIWLENRSGRARPVEVALEVVSHAAGRAHGSPGIETGDATLERHRQAAMLRPAPRVVDVAMEFIDAGVELTFDGTGTRVVMGRKNGALVDPAGLERAVLRNAFNDLARIANVEAIVTKSISGHQTEQMRGHYSTVTPGEQRESIGRLLRLVSTMSRSANADDDAPRGGAPSGAPPLPSGATGTE